MQLMTTDSTYHPVGVAAIAELLGRGHLVAACAGAVGVLLGVAAVATDVKAVAGTLHLVVALYAVGIVVGRRSLLILLRNVQRHVGIVSAPWEFPVITGVVVAGLLDLLHLIVGAVEQFLPDMVLCPLLSHAVQELLAMVLVLIAAQSRALVAIAHGLVVGDGVEQCPNEGAKIMRMLKFRTQLCRQQDGVAVPLVVLSTVDVLVGDARHHVLRKALATLGSIDDADPKALLLLVGAEGGAHANPVVALRVLNDVAQTVVARATPDVVAVITDLVWSAIDDARKVGDEFRVHIDHGQIVGTRSRGCPCQRAVFTGL